MPDLENRGVPKDYDNSSHACVFYWPAGLHDPDCTPLEPWTEEERETTRQIYKDKRVKARLRASEKAYEKRNHLQRGKE